MDNPSAFPQSEWAFEGGDGREGMTLRDWFAGQAAAGLLADPEVQPSQNTLPWNGLAKQAYAIADAMLAARTGSSS